MRHLGRATLGAMVVAAALGILSQRPAPPGSDAGTLMSGPTHPTEPGSGNGGRTGFAPVVVRG